MTTTHKFPSLVLTRVLVALEVGVAALEAGPVPPAEHHHGWTCRHESGSKVLFLFRGGKNIGEGGRLYFIEESKLLYLGV